MKTSKIINTWASVGIITCALACFAWSSTAGADESASTLSSTRAANDTRTGPVIFSWSVAQDHLCGKNFAYFCLLPPKSDDLDIMEWDDTAYQIKDAAVSLVVSVPLNAEEVNVTRDTAARVKLSVVSLNDAKCVFVPPAQVTQARVALGVSERDCGSYRTRVLVEMRRDFVFSHDEAEQRFVKSSEVTPLSSESVIAIQWDSDTDEQAQLYSFGEDGYLEVPRERYCSPKGSDIPAMTQCVTGRCAGVCDLSAASVYQIYALSQTVSDSAVATRLTPYTWNYMLEYQESKMTYSKRLSTQRLSVNVMQLENEFVSLCFYTLSGAALQFDLCQPDGPLPSSAQDAGRQCRPLEQEFHVRQLGATCKWFSKKTLVDAAGAVGCADNCVLEMREFTGKPFVCRVGAASTDSVIFSQLTPEPQSVSVGLSRTIVVQTEGECDSDDIVSPFAASGSYSLVGVPKTMAAESVTSGPTKGSSGKVCRRVFTALFPDFTGTHVTVIARKRYEYAVSGAAASKDISLPAFVSYDVSDMVCFPGVTFVCLSLFEQQSRPVGMDNREAYFVAPDGQRRSLMLQGSKYLPNLSVGDGNNFQYCFGVVPEMLMHAARVVGPRRALQAGNTTEQFDSCQVEGKVVISFLDLKGEGVVQYGLQRSVDTSELSLRHVTVRPHPFLVLRRLYGQPAYNYTIASTVAVYSQFYHTVCQSSATAIRRCGRDAISEVADEYKYYIYSPDSYEVLQKLRTKRKLEIITDRRPMRLDPSYRHVYYNPATNGFPLTWNLVEPKKMKSTLVSFCFGGLVSVAQEPSTRSPAVLDSIYVTLGSDGSPFPLTSVERVDYNNEGLEQCFLVELSEIFKEPGAVEAMGRCAKDFCHTVVEIDAIPNGHLPESFHVSVHQSRVSVTEKRYRVFRMYRELLVTVEKLCNESTEITFDLPVESKYELIKKVDGVLTPGARQVTSSGSCSFVFVWRGPAKAIGLLGRLTI